MILRNTTGELGLGIDTKGDGGYVIAAGIHQSGARYCSEGQTIAVAPAWILALVQERAAKRSTSAVVPCLSDETSRYGRAVLDAEVQRVADAPIGEGNNTLYDAALRIGSFVAGGEIALADAQHALRRAANRWRFRDKASPKTIESGLTNGRKNPRKAPEQDNGDSQ